MTIIVERRRHDEAHIRPKLKKAKQMLMSIVDQKNANFHKMMREADQKKNRLKAAAIRRYARKNKLNLFHKRKPWHVYIHGSALKISMPSGYFAWVGKVLEKIEAE